MGSYLRVNLLGPGPRLLKKRIYRASVSRKLRNTALPDNRQHSQETDIHAPSGIRTCNPSRQAAAEPRFGPRGHRDRHPDSLLR